MAVAQALTGFVGLIGVGKPFKVALTAIMREPLTTINAMMHDQNSWNAYPVTT